jgi:hypothetical protein
MLSECITFFISISLRYRAAANPFLGTEALQTEALAMPSYAILKTNGPTTTELFS